MWIPIRKKTFDFSLDGSLLARGPSREIIDAPGKVLRIRMTSQDPISASGRGDTRTFFGNSRPHVLEYASDIAGMQRYGTMEITSYYILKMPWEKAV